MLLSIDSRWGWEHSYFVESNTSAVSYDAHGNDRMHNNVKRIKEAIYSTDRTSGRQHFGVVMCIEGEWMVVIMPISHFHLLSAVICHFPLSKSLIPRHQRHQPRPGHSRRESDGRKLAGRRRRWRSDQLIDDDQLFDENDAVSLALSCFWHASEGFCVLCWHEPPYGSRAIAK